MACGYFFSIISKKPNIATSSSRTLGCNGRRSYPKGLVSTRVKGFGQSFFLYCNEVHLKSIQKLLNKDKYDDEHLYEREKTLDIIQFLEEVVAS